jgi:hypothetical protein
MKLKVRKIEVDVETADLLEARDLDAELGHAERASAAEAAQAVKLVVSSSALSDFGRLQAFARDR